MTTGSRFALLLCLFFPMTVMAAAGERLPVEHGQWLQRPSQQLIDMADADMDNGGSKDTALVCYSIVVNRYDPAMREAQKQLCADAYMHLWTIYYYDFYDYPKCFECLTRAREIADEIGREVSNIYLGFGCMYQTISEETGNTELGAKALDYYILAMNAGMRTNDDSHTDMACTNVLSMATQQKGLASIDQEWQSYRWLPEAGETVLLRRYNKLLHAAYSHIEQRQYDEAIAIFDRQLQMIEGTEYSRLIYFTCVEKAKVFAKKGDFNDAIATLARPEQIAVALEMKDCMLEVFGLLAEYYGRQGHERQRQLYRESYIALKDTLTNYHQLASVNEMEFRGELKQMDRQMAEMRRHREVMARVAAVTAVFVLILLALLVVVFRQNGRLKRSNRQLYQTNVAMLRAEEERRQMRRQLQASKETKNGGSNGESENNSCTEEVKYKNSNLSDDDKTMLLGLITDVMENSPEVFSPDFSVERLAVLTDSKYKYVSQVIHEHCGLNFNAFLNQYRIKEACKRMSDTTRYGNYTIEAIANDVGFRSRSAFASSFKRITGLTPSEYQRFAQDAQP